MLRKLVNHRCSILNLRKRCPHGRENDRLNLICSQLRSIERRSRIAEEKDVKVSHIGFPSRGLAADIGADPGNDYGIDPPVAKDELEIRAGEGAIARLLKDNVAGADNDAGVEFGLGVSLIDEFLLRSRE